MKFRNFASVINYYQPLAAFIQSGMFFTGDCADLKFFLALQSADDGTYTPTHILSHNLGQVSEILYRGTTVNFAAGGLADAASSTSFLNYIYTVLRYANSAFTTQFVFGLTRFTSASTRVSDDHVMLEQPGELRILNGPVYVD